MASKEVIQKILRIFRGEIPILEEENEEKLATFDSDTYIIVRKQDKHGTTRSYLQSKAKDNKPDAWTWTWVAKVNGIRPGPP